MEILNRIQLEADQDWWALFSAAFLPDERDPVEVLLETVEHGHGLALAHRQEGKTIALGFVHLLTDPAAVFLVYLAVDPGHRSSGLGRQLLEFAWEEGARTLSEAGLPPLGLVWEVDQREETGDAAHGRREARLRFFDQLGGRPLPIEYLQPPINGPAPVPMDLFFRPVPGLEQPDREGARRLARAIFVEKYGAMNRLPWWMLGALLERI